MVRKYWTKKETLLLKKIYNDCPIKDASTKLNATWEQIRNKAKKLGFKRNRIKCFMKKGTNHTFFDSWSEQKIYQIF